MNKFKCNASLSEAYKVTSSALQAIGLRLILSWSLDE